MWFASFDCSTHFLVKWMCAVTSVWNEANFHSVAMPQLVGQTWPTLFGRSTQSQNIIWSATFWLAETAQWLAAWNPLSCHTLKEKFGSMKTLVSHAFFWCVVVSLSWTHNSTYRVNGLCAWYSYSHQTTTGQLTLTSSGQPKTENGNNADENHVSKTSSSEKKTKNNENEMQKCIYIPTHFSKTVLFCQPHQQLFTHSNTYSHFINKNSLLVMQTWQNETEKRKKTTTASNNNEALVPLYWAIQAGLLTPLTFARHRLSPLAAFTSGAYYLHNGRRWLWICEFYTANVKGIFWGTYS